MEIFSVVCAAAAGIRDTLQQILMGKSGNKDIQKVFSFYKYCDSFVLFDRNCNFCQQRQSSLVAVT